jgi:hypothetical protein
LVIGTWSLVIHWAFFGHWPLAIGHFDFPHVSRCMRPIIPMDHVTDDRSLIPNVNLQEGECRETGIGFDSDRDVGGGGLPEREEERDQSVGDAA